MKSMLSCACPRNKTMARWFGAVLLCGLTMTGARAEKLVDSINAGVVPEESANIFYGSTFNQIGWYYTPGTSYELTGIDSYFNSLSSASATATQPITITVYSERPTLGGTEIAATTFAANAHDGEIQGGDFSGIDLVAGTQYFIGFSGLSGMGVNVASWSYVNGVETLSPGVVSLGAYYRDANFELEVTTPFQTAYNSSGVAGNVSGTSPILYFYGNLPSASPVPEPSTLTLAGLGVCTWLGLRARRRHLCART